MQNSQTNDNTEWLGLPFSSPEPFRSWDDHRDAGSRAERCTRLCLARQLEVSGSRDWSRYIHRIRESREIVGVSGTKGTSDATASFSRRQPVTAHSPVANNAMIKRASP